MKFNKDQREGLAKVLDNIATAFIIGVSIGTVAVGDHKISISDAILVCSFAVSLISIAITLRGVKES